MPISYTYNLIFIHIPKCAGTTIEKMIGTCTSAEYYDLKSRLKSGQLKTPQHFTYLELKNVLDVDWSNYHAFSIVRNPYTRFVSEYNYRKDLFTKTKKPEHDPKDFVSFVGCLDMEVSQRTQLFDGHLETQSSFLKNEIGAIESSIQVFNFENLAPCWTMIEEKTGVKYTPYFWFRKNNSNIPYQDFYTPELKSIVYNFYKEDFDNFNYNSEL